MIVFALIVITLLVMATALFIVPVMRGERVELATSRDALNKAFYHHRLSELEQDEDQGVVRWRFTGPLSTEAAKGLAQMLAHA